MIRSRDRRSRRFEWLEFFIGLGLLGVCGLGVYLLFRQPRPSDPQSSSSPAVRQLGNFAAVGAALPPGGGDLARIPARFLVISSSSCVDIAPPKPWLYRAESADGAPPEYDVVLFDYGVDNACAAYVPAAVPRVGSARPSFELQLRPRTYKWPAMYAFFTSPTGRLALLSYDYFLLSDDDVDFENGPGGVVRLLRACAAAEMHLCQPGLSARSAINFNATAAVDRGGGVGGVDAAAGGERIRLAGFVEQMSPVFSREALMQFLPYFRDVTHAWGIDMLWSDASARLGRRVGVVDSVAIDHLRPAGVSNLYARVGGIDKARADQDAFKRKHSISDAIFAAADAFGEGETVYTRAAA